jgi:transcriptional regulator with XRE-family HTH domain
MPRVPKQTLAPIADTEETIGQRIARFRKMRGFTQKQLAEKIGIVQNLVSDYENGKLRLYDEMLAHFASALKVSADELLGLKKDEELPALSLRFIKRLSVIETFPEAKKKHILRTLDDSIKANTSETEE